MSIVSYAKEHPIASGIIAIVGVFIFVMIAGGGSSSSSSSSSDQPSDAEIAANAQIAAAQINAQAATSAANIGAGVQMNSDNKAAEVAMAQINMYSDVYNKQTDAQLAALQTATGAETAKTNALLAALPSLKKKNRDEALQAIATGQVVQSIPNYGNSAAGIINSVGNAAGGIGSALGSIFSDQRLKENIRFVGWDKQGREVYDFNYKGSTRTRRGYIAQSLKRTDPELVSEDKTGYYRIQLPSNG